MSKIKIGFLILIMCLCFNRATKAQQEFILNGVIFENGSKIRIALSEIYNIRNKFSVGSNDMGLFQIKTMVGDTLIISKRGFTSKRVVVTSVKEIIVNLNSDQVTLNEVVVNGQNKKQTLNALKQDYKNKGSFYAGKPPLLSLFGTPLTFLYELIGRTPRNARRFNKMAVTELQNNQVDQLYNKNTINKNTGLEGKELENFLVNYRPDYDKAKNWTVYDATKWIKDSYKEYTDTLKKN